MHEIKPTNTPLMSMAERQDGPAWWEDALEPGTMPIGRETLRMFVIEWVRLGTMSPERAFATLWNAGYRGSELRLK